MTDLKALRRDMAEKVGYDLHGDDYNQSQLEQLVDVALLQYAQACLGEPSEAMDDAGHEDVVWNGGPCDIWRAMAAQRARELE